MHETLKLFQHDHLPAELQAVAAPFAAWAEELVDRLPHNRQLQLSLDHLLDAKDCAVRAKMV